MRWFVPLIWRIRETYFKYVYRQKLFSKLIFPLINSIKVDKTSHLCYQKAVKTNALSRDILRNANIIAYLLAVYCSYFPFREKLLIFYV